MSSTNNSNRTNTNVNRIQRDSKENGMSKEAIKKVIEINKKYELVARWIHGESSEPISEIEFLLNNSYDKVEELEEAYGDVIKHMEEDDEC